MLVPLRCEAPMPQQKSWSNASASPWRGSPNAALPSVQQMTDAGLGGTRVADGLKDLNALSWMVKSERVGHIT